MAEPEAVSAQGATDPARRERSSKCLGRLSPEDIRDLVEFTLDSSSTLNHLLGCVPRGPHQTGQGFHEQAYGI